jgi:putative flippase GtrA
MNFQAANAAGYASGTVLSFALNSRFNFRARDWLTLRFLSFCVVGVLGLTVSYAALRLLINGHGVNKYLAKLAAIAIVVLLQYNLNRIISFRQTRPTPDE